MIDYPVKERYTFEDLVAINHILRSPGGCPWDQVQTHQSIRRNFLEEVYECCEALDNDDPVLMQEELGDVLMQVVFHADLETDRGRFTLDDVCDGACRKLIFRHPNVFGEKTAQTWDDMKALEKGQKTASQTLDAVARSLPALWRAEKLLQKAAKAGLCRQMQTQAVQTLREETEALQAAVREGSRVEEKLGDVLFAAVCAGVMGGADPEMALHSTCEAFIRRFTAVEEQARAKGTELGALTPEEQQTLWQAAENA